MSLTGVIISGISVGAFKFSAFGVDPFQSFMSGAAALIPVAFGTLYMLVNIGLLLFSLLADRSRIGIATFINLFLLGYIVDFSHGLIQHFFQAPGIPGRCVFFLIGFVALCFGSSLYMTADLGVSTYDAVAIVLSGKWKLGQFQYVRICTDLVCVALGVGLFLLSGGSLAQIPAIAGIGTVITAFFMGPLIQFFCDRVAKPLLEKGN